MKKLKEIQGTTSLTIDELRAIEGGTGSSEPKVDFWTVAAEYGANLFKGLINFS